MDGALGRVWRNNHTEQDTKKYLLGGWIDQPGKIAGLLPV